MRRSDQAGPRWNVTAGLLFAGAVSAILILQVADSSKAAVSLSLMTLLLVGFAAYWRFHKRRLDPLGLFCAAFALYDGLMLLRLTLVSSEKNLAYPTTFSDQTYANAGVLTVLAAATILITAFFWEAVIAPQFDQACAKSAWGKSRVMPEIRATGAHGWFWAGFLSFAAGVSLFFAEYAQLGGYLATLAMERGERFATVNDPSLLSYPYGAFLIPGLAAMFLAAYGGGPRWQRIAACSCAAAWFGLVILQGDRRPLLQAAFAIVAVLSVVRPALLKVKMSTWILVGLGYLFFSTFGNVRSQIASIASGQASASEALAEASDEWSEEWLAPENTEFAGPFFSLLSATSGNAQLLYGKSYYDSFLFVVPKALYPGRKPELLTQQFAEQVHEGGGTVYGWGYNPVAEAFLNFGVAGVVLAFVLWTLFFLVLGSLKQQGTWGVLVFAALFAEAVNANRIDFRVVYCESVYLILGVIAVVGGGRLLSSRVFGYARSVKF